ncbi:hypothetical protein R3P38DRAFT_3420988 [Favolaschia claudopus]|uniref:Uncharacterized protein n=1 Tax=Favolaschia claudopus TaxID=2862362 RepID=A0AAW0D5H9_9AGAR
MSVGVPPAAPCHRHYRLCDDFRSGWTRIRRFSPWEGFVAWNPAELSALGFAVHQTSVSLEELLDRAQSHNDEQTGGGGEGEEAGCDSDEEYVGDSLNTEPCSSRLPTVRPPPPPPPPPSSSSLPPSPPPPLPPVPPLTTGRTAAQDRKARYHKARRQERRQELASNPFERRSAPNSSIPTHLISEPERLQVDFDATHLKTTKGGHWLGVGDRPPPKMKNRPDSERWAKFRLRELSELVNDLNHHHVSWDARRPLLILDRHGRIIVVFVGGPDDPEWPAVAAAAAETMHRVREEGISTGAFPLDAGIHRRGRFFTLKSGVSHGGGQPVCAFRTWAPKLFKDYVTDLQDLFKHDPKLRLNFTNSLFPSVTFNLGPQSASFEHLDDKNRALGWCAITSGGDFDAKRSALLYLKELNTVVDFPAAATSFIPSAVIHHGNTPLAPNETRYSITQYAAGGLFRYIQYNFRTAKKVLEAGGENLKRSLDGRPGERHDAGLDLFSKADELMADHMACFARDG